MGAYGNNFGNNWNAGPVLRAGLAGQQGFAEPPRQIQFSLEKESMSVNFDSIITKREETQITMSALILQRLRKSFFFNGIIQRNESLLVTFSFLRNLLEQFNLGFESFKNQLENFDLIPKTIPVTKRGQARALLNDSSIKGAVARGRARIILTKTNKKLVRVEGSCESFLEKNARIFIASDTPIQNLTNRHGDEIYEFILNCGRRAFKLGFQYIENATNLDLPIDANDEQIIRGEADIVFSSFWNTVRRGREERTIKPLKQKIKGAIAFDFIHVLVTAFTTNLINKGTIESTAKIQNSDFASDFFIQSATGEFEPVYEFVTMRDDRVDCRICKPLDGLLMSPSDPFFVIPGRALHWGCRCRLLLRSGNDTITG